MFYFYIAYIYSKVKILLNINAISNSSKCSRTVNNRNMCASTNLNISSWISSALLGII